VEVSCNEQRCRTKTRFRRTNHCKLTRRDWSASNPLLVELGEWGRFEAKNVITGKLIPAGSGLARYRNNDVEPTEEAKAAVYAPYGEYDFTLFALNGVELV